MKNQIFIPTVARFSGDIATSWNIQQPLIEAGYQPGLMLVLRKGLKGLLETSAAQLQNLERLTAEYGKSAVAVMLSNLPIEDSDLLRHPAAVQKYIEWAVGFARSLPIGGRRIVTFHLDSLVSREKFSSCSRTEWRRTFEEEVMPVLRSAAAFARKIGVDLMVETVPVPEFGDSDTLMRMEHQEYGDIALCDLRNPFYLTSLWGFEQVREAGLGICLDLCHARTIYGTARTAGWKGVLFGEDVPALSGMTVLNDVKALLPSDIVHVNDGSGMYDDNDGTFKEGVALGQGDIAELPEILRILDEKKIAWVLEVNETDLMERPNTISSIEYIIKNAAGR